MNVILVMRWLDNLTPFVKEGLGTRLRRHVTVSFHLALNFRSVIRPLKQIFKLNLNLQFLYYITSPVSCLQVGDWARTTTAFNTLNNFCPTVNMNWIFLNLFCDCVQPPFSQFPTLFHVDSSSKKLPKVGFYFSFKIVASPQFPKELVALSNLKSITLCWRV